MNSEEKATKGCFYTLMAAILLSVMVNVFLIKLHNEQPSVVVEHDTIWKDTVIREPVAAETIQTDRVVYIKVAVAQPHTQRDTVHDSIEVPVPIVQKRYDDSLYTAWVSGFEPNLDSLQLHQPEIITTITKTIVKPSQLITVGIQTGGGYGIFNRQFDMYVGVGAQINLWRK